MRTKVLTKLYFSLKCHLCPEMKEDALIQIHELLVDAHTFSHLTELRRTFILKVKVEKLHRKYK